MLFPGIEGRYWMAMRISSGSECTPSFGRYPEGVVIAPDGNKAYVANWASGDISVLNGETGQELRRIKASSGARALAIVPAG